MSEEVTVKVEGGGGGGGAPAGETSAAFAAGVASAEATQAKETAQAAELEAKWANQMAEYVAQALAAHEEQDRAEHERLAGEVREARGVARGLVRYLHEEGAEPVPAADTTPTVVEGQPAPAGDQGGAPPAGDQGGTPPAPAPTDDGLRRCGAFW